MVRTGLVYDNLDDCVKAEQTMRSEYTRVYNQWLEWAMANPKEADYPKSQPFYAKTHRRTNNWHLHTHRES